MWTADNVACFAFGFMSGAFIAYQMWLWACDTVERAERTRQVRRVREPVAKSKDATEARDGLFTDWWRDN